MSTGNCQMTQHYPFAQKVALKTLTFLGLFHSALAMSGTALNPWAFQRNPATRAKQIADFAGCNANKTEDMIACLKLLPLDKFGQAQKKFTVSIIYIYFYG